MEEHHHGVEFADERETNERHGGLIITFSQLICGNSTGSRLCRHQNNPPSFIPPPVDPHHPNRKLLFLLCLD
jgi:hypothetical protein